MNSGKKLSLLLVVFFVIPVMSMAQMGRHFDSKMAGLNLSEEQETKLEAEHTTHQKTMIQLMADLKVAKLELAEALKSGKSEKEVNSKLEALNAAHAAVLKSQTAHKLKVREILGVEKFAQWSAHHGMGMGPMQMNHGSKCGMGGFDGPGPKGHRPGRK